MTIIDGKKIAAAIEVRVKEGIEKSGRSLSLTSLFVGEATDSALYTKRKAEAAQRLGISFTVERLPETASEEEVAEAIARLNNDKSVDGFIVQLPLPAQLREATDRLLNMIDPKKDVDGLTVITRKRFLSGAADALVPTPVAAVVAAVRSLDRTFSGESAVIISDGDIFAETLRYSLEKIGLRTRIERSDVSDFSGADVIVTAVGKPGFLKGNMIKEGCVIVDVGTTLVDGKTRGDVDWETVVQQAAAATPVPGGVGPVTVAMLYANLLALKAHQSK